MTSSRYAKENSHIDSRLIKPRNRSRLRMFAGKTYYTIRRCLDWHISSVDFAYQTGPVLPFKVFSHQTPLLRRLRNVDMWLQHNKVNNLKIAAAKIDGIIINPGETFSFWRTVGKPTRRKGYVDGMVLCNGSFYPGMGGGLCQLSNLIYWMALHNPLTIAERWRHNYDVFPDSDRQLPFGCGATVAYNYIDLQIRNDTSSPFQLRVWVGDTYLHGEVRSDHLLEGRYQVYESQHHISHEWWGGYLRHNTLRRKLFNRQGEETCDQFITENHAIMMYSPLLKGKY